MSTLLNFGLFSVAYNILATPYIHESQRVDNAEVIMLMVFPGYILFSCISVLSVYLLSRKLA